MTQENKINLSNRVEQLEKRVEELQQLVKQLNEKLTSRGSNLKDDKKGIAQPQRIQTQSHVQPTASIIQKPPVAPGPKPRPSRKPLQIPENLRKSEFWLSKIGIGLLLFGVVFLFKYSIDQGWITPTIRVVFGLALGIGLLVTGLRIYSKRPHFSQVLLGGSIATFYICGFSAFQLYNLISHPFAFVFMVSVTLLAFVLALKQNEAILSLIGAIGGFGTPFLLYTGSGSLPGLVGYTCLMLAGTGAIYFFRGWRSLLWLSVIGGWIVFLIGLNQGLLTEVQPILGDRWSLQIGVIFGWLSFWALPLTREIVWAKNPQKWPRPPFDFAEKSISQDTKIILNRHMHVLTVSTPLIALMISMQIWSLSDESWGWITMGIAMVYGLIYWKLKYLDPIEDLVYTHALEAGLLFTIALCLIFSGDTLFFVLSVEATILTLIARRLSDKFIANIAHIFFTALAMWLWFRLNQTQQIETAMLNARALTDLCAISAAFGLSKLYGPTTERRIYLLAAVIALTGLLVRELDGNLLFFMIAVEASILYIIARRLSDKSLVVASHIFFVVLGLWLGGRLLSQVHGQAIINTQALTDLLVIAAIVFITKLSNLADEKFIYRLFCHVAILGWFLRELSTLPNGQGYVTIAWGLYALTLLILGLRLNQSQLRTVAVGTLLIMVGKLFLVDLSKLKAIWRILLFLGFGGVFLVVSYYFQSLWKGEKQTSENLE